MSLDLSAKAALLGLCQIPTPPRDGISVTDYRQIFRTIATMSGRPKLPIARVEDRQVGAFGIRLYHPAPDRCLPVVIYYHGGGWTIGDLDIYDEFARRLCQLCDCIVVSVDYRLAPEHPFPAAPEDAVAAVHWVVDHAASFGGDPAKIVVAGDSAGGNLAAVAAQALPGRLRGQILIYPSTHFMSENTSYAHYGTDDYFLSRQIMEWFSEQYVRDPKHFTDVRLCPFLAEDVRGLPPAQIITAECDPLCEEGQAYADKLKAAGVPVEHIQWQGQIHGFAVLLGVIPAADSVLAVMNVAVQRFFKA